MRTNRIKATPELNKFLVASASSNREEAMNALAEIAMAIQLPLRDGIMSGDILNGIYEPIPLTNNATPEFPLSFLAPGTEKDFVSYAIPNHGFIPQRHVEGDYVMVPVYDIGNSIGWNTKYARDARWDVVRKAGEVLRGGFVKKINDDGWQTILAAAADRNIIVLDSDANAGQFTKRLVSLMKTVMRRNGGGNSTSVNRGKLTDLFISVEAMEDIRNWNVEQIDELTRRDIFMAEGDNAISRIFGVNLQDLDELGEGQEYQLFFDDQLNGTLPAGDVEIVVGLDLSNRDSFVMPIRQEVEIVPDDSLRRMRRSELFGTAELGMAVLDNRRVLLGSL